MGYEIRIYLGKPANWKGTDKRTWIEVLGMLNLCKIGCGETTKLIRNWNNKDDYYFYGDDGNTEIKEDSYGDPIKIIPAKEFLKAIRKDNKEDPYRRFLMAIALIRETLKHFPEAVVMCYGY